MKVRDNLLPSYRILSQRVRRIIELSLHPRSLRKPVCQSWTYVSPISTNLLSKIQDSTLQAWLRSPIHRYLLGSFGSPFLKSILKLASAKVTGTLSSFHICEMIVNSERFASFEYLNTSAGTPSGPVA